MDQRDEPPSRSGRTPPGLPWRGIVGAGLLQIACLAGLSYLAFDDAVTGAAVGIGGLLGLLLVNSPPFRRMLARLRGISRWGGGRRDERWR